MEVHVMAEIRLISSIFYNALCEKENKIVTSTYEEVHNSIRE